MSNESQIEKASAAPVFNKDSLAEPRQPYRTAPATVKIDGTIFQLLEPDRESQQETVHIAVVDKATISVIST
jgi:hypothetical protein